MCTLVDRSQELIVPSRQPLLHTLEANPAYLAASAFLTVLMLCPFSNLYPRMVLAGTETEVSLSHDKYATVRSLKVAAAQAFGIQIQGEFDAVSLTNSFEVSVQAAVDAINDAYASCGGAALSDLRLREMSLSWKVPSKHLNSEGIESGTLADINLYSHKTLYLEVAPHHGADFVDDGWVEDGIWARVSKYDPNLPGEGAGDGKGGPPQRGALAEPISVCISKVRGGGACGDRGCACSHGTSPALAALSAAPCAMALLPPPPCGCSCSSYICQEALIYFLAVSLFFVPHPIKANLNSFLLLPIPSVHCFTCPFMNSRAGCLGTRAPRSQLPAGSPTRAVAAC